MNRTNFEHAFYALLMQLAAWPFFGPWAGVWIALAYFWSREVMQRELYLKHLRGFDTLDKLAPFEGWRFWEWGRDSLLDVALPAAATIIVALYGDWIALAVLACLSGPLAFLGWLFDRLDKQMEGY